MIREMNPSPLHAAPRLLLYTRACLCVHLALLFSTVTEGEERSCMTLVHAGYLLSWLQTERRQQGKVSTGAWTSEVPGLCPQICKLALNCCCKLLGFACMSERRSGSQPMTQGSWLLCFILTVLLMTDSYFWVISKAFPASIPQPRHLQSLPCDFCPLSS